MTQYLRLNVRPVLLVHPVVLVEVLLTSCETEFVVSVPMYVHTGVKR